MALHREAKEDVRTALVRRLSDGQLTIHSIRRRFSRWPNSGAWRQMERTPCSQCGVSILLTTAAKNSGLCMPCATGTRASIEASKAHYRKQREREATDPVRALWRSLVDRVHRSDSGYAALTEAEKRYFAVALLEGEVHNGGFDLYFFNSSSDSYQDAVAGLEEMGATTSLDLLLRAKQIVFDFGEVPAGTLERRQTSHSRSDARTSRLDCLDRLFWDDPDGLVIRIEAFLYKHGLVPRVA